MHIMAQRGKKQHHLELLYMESKLATARETEHWVEAGTERAAGKQLKILRLAEPNAVIEHDWCLH